MKKIFLRNRLTLLLLGIITLATFVRFYQLPDRLYFQLDEERDLHMIRRILIHHDVPFIGGQIPGGLFLGPLYFWTTAIITWLVNFNPFSLGYIAALIGTVDTLIIYLLGKNLFNKRTALIASAIWAASLLISFFNQIWWPLVYLPSIALIAYWSLQKIKEGNNFYIIVLALDLTIGIHSEPSVVAVILTTIFFWIAWKLPLNRKTATAVGIFVSSHLPLLLFDIKHNFQTLKGFSSFISGSSTELNLAQFINSIKRTFELITTVVTQIILPININDRATIISWCPEYSPLQNTLSQPPVLALTAILLFAGITAHIRKNGWTVGAQLLTVHSVISLAGIILYQAFFPGYLHIWFFYSLFPLCAMLFGLSFSYLIDKSRLIGIIVVGALVIFNSIKATNVNDSFGLGNKQKAVEYALSSVGPTTKLAVDSIGRCFNWSGYRYLMVWKKRPPVKSYLDSAYGAWLYPKELSNEEAEATVVFVDHEPIPFNDYTQQKYLQIKNRAHASAKFGGIEVLIINN